MAAVSPTPTIEVITSEPKASTDSKEDNAGDITTQFVGLEELNNTDKIVVQQMTGLVAAACCCGYEGENMFEISDRLGTYQDMVSLKKKIINLLILICTKNCKIGFSGHIIMRAHEDSNCCSRQCCERLRSFEMTIKDRKSESIIRIVRPQRCDNCLCFPCLNQVISLANRYI